MAYLPQRALDAIAKDGTAAIIYSREDPKRVVFPGDLERMPKSYGSLLLGVVSLLVGIGLISIRHRFTGPAGHLRVFGDGDIGAQD